MHKLAGVNLIDTIKMMTLTPARLINADTSKGSVETGKDADLVIFDEDINVCLTVVEGKTVYKAY